MEATKRFQGPRSIFHLLHAWSMVFLIITGFILHWPPAGVNLSPIRFLHVTVGIANLVGLIPRIYYAFVGPQRDWREFILSKDDWRRLLCTVKYYFFLPGGCSPPEGTYNPLQKLTYLLIVVFLVVVQSWYGLKLAWPATFAQNESLLLVRSLHYAGTWLILAFLITHIYLALTEAREHLSIMLLGISKKPGEVKGAQDIGFGNR